MDFLSKKFLFWGFNKLVKITKNLKKDYKFIVFFCFMVDKII